LLDTLVPLQRRDSTFQAPRNYPTSCAAASCRSVTPRPRCPALDCCAVRLRRRRLQRENADAAIVARP